MVIRKLEGIPTENLVKSVASYKRTLSNATDESTTPAGRQFLIEVVASIESEIARRKEFKSA